MRNKLAHKAICTIIESGDKNMLTGKSVLIVCFVLFLATLTVQLETTAHHAPTFPPTILSIDFPLVVPYGAVVEGKLLYRDSDKDLQTFTCRSLTKALSSLRCIESPVMDSSQGETRFVVVAPGVFDSLKNLQRASLRLTLADEAGNSTSVDVSFTLSPKTQVFDTLIHQLSTESGLALPVVQLLADTEVTTDTFSLVAQNLSIGSQFLTEVFKPVETSQIHFRTAFQLEQGKFVKNVLGIANLQLVNRTDRLRLNLWTIGNEVLISPVLVDQYGVIKYEPILYRFIAKEAIRIPVVRQAHRPLPFLDPPNSIPIPNRLGFTVVTADLRVEDMQVRSDDGIHIRRNNGELDVSLPFKPNLSTAPLYQADGRVEQAGGPMLKSSEEPIECIVARALIAYGSLFPTFTFTISPLSVNIGGFAIDNGFENLYLTRCADGTVIFEAP